jgi:hypothetical protein
LLSDVFSHLLIRRANDLSGSQRESQIAHFVIAITFAEAIAGQSWAGLYERCDPVPCHRSLRKKPPLSHGQRGGGARNK